jgi:GT2 family glycosyltransferase
VDRYWLAELVKGFALGEQVGCVTGIAFPLELQTQAQLWFEMQGYFSKGLTRRVFDLAENRLRNPVFPYSAGIFGTGANMAFRTAALRAVGGFDPALGPGSPALGGEDLAAFFQIIMAGKTLVYEPGAIVHHLHRRDYAGLRQQMHGYGVGLTAYLTKCVIDKPGLVLDLAVKAPYGMAHALRAQSRKNAKRPYDYPRELVLIERRGLLLGPWAYVRSRWTMRTWRKQAEPPLGRVRPALPVEETAEFRPVRVLEVELGAPLPDILPSRAAAGQVFERALVLVRLHTRPLGAVEMALVDGGLGAACYAQAIWCSLAKEIAAHLRQDGLPAPTTLEAAGLPSASTPPCLQERDAVLAQAPFVSIVVATRDRPESLAVCLDSLLALDYPHCEILVVDNAPSTSATADLITHSYADSGRVRYVREDRPGIGWARNRGLEEVRGEIVAFTDDDVVVDRYWLAELVKGFALGEQVGCVTGMIFPTELQTQAQLWIEQFGGFSKGYTQRVFDLAEHRVRNRLYPYSAGAFGSGANMSFRTAALRAVGGFDPALGPGSPGVGGEDLAAFFQIIMAGKTLVYEPGAIVHHVHRRDYAGLRKQVHGYGVGLTAYLTKCVIDKPSLAVDLATRIPHGVAYALSSRSAKNAGKSHDYPHELTVMERRGMLLGPWAYVRGRWIMRKLKSRVGR